MKSDYTVTVNVKTDEKNKSVVNIITPKSQKELTARQMVHVLIGGVTLLVKSCEKHDLGIKDFELMKEIYAHLEETFIGDEFADAKLMNMKKVQK
jgi:hypothetical protein